MPKARDRHFEEFRGHTLLKHVILRAYLQTWAMKLLSVPGKRIWFIDGFAGQGMDEAGNPGSPIIASQIALEMLDAKGTRGGDAPMQVIAIESDRGRYRKLKRTLEPFTQRVPSVAYAAYGRLSDHIEKISRGIGNSPALYFLDPYGIKGLRHEDYVMALAGPQNEMFVLFSDTGARRLYASLLSKGRNLEVEIAALRQQPGLFASIDRAEEQRTAEEIERSNRALQSTQQAARRYLAEALGVDIDELVTGDAVESQAENLTRLFMDRLRAAGAEFVLRFPMRNEENNEVYQLVYASKSAVGLRAMKEAMHQGLNSRQLPRKVAEAIKEDLTVDTDGLLQRIPQRFSGRVRWTKERDRGPTDTVKKFLLEETPAFPWQFEEVKRGLVARGYRRETRPITYEF